MFRWLLHVGQHVDEKREVEKLKQENRTQRLLIEEALEDLTRARSKRRPDD